MRSRQGDNQPTALGHLRIIELGDVPASYATRYLADLGADVIKVEPPAGDPSRYLPPFAGDIEHPERSLTFINANTNKRSILLDLNHARDIEIFSALLVSADLLFEATPFGDLENLGLTDERLKDIYPGLVTVSLTPFGRTGPYRQFKGSDAIANGAGGFLYAQGDDKKGPCTAPGFPMRLSATPMRFRRPAPLLGEHQEEILAELKQTPPKRDALPVDPEKARRPMLDGLRMADLTQQFAGPLGTAILGYYGMEVIKIESGTVPSKGRATAVHADMNRAKLGCTINLRHPEGKELFQRLIAVSNVVVDNFSAGVMERLGFSFEELQKINRGIVQVVMPGWGLTGPLQSWVAWGWQLLAFNGLMALWGYPDSPMQSRCKIAWPDRAGAITMALGVLAAIEYQERTGQGQFIEAAMLEAQGAMMGPAILDYTVNAKEWEALGYDEILGAPYAPYGCYPCRGEDNWIIIACENDAEWRDMVRLIGESSWAADGRFAIKAGRKEHRKELDRKLAAWTRELTPRLAFRLLQEAGVAAGIPMSGEDLYYDIHLSKRRHIVEIDEPPWGRVTHHGLPGIPSLSEASAARPAPWIGAHNSHVFHKILGMSEAAIKALKEKNAIE